MEREPACTLFLVGRAGGVEGGAAQYTVSNTAQESEYNTRESSGLLTVFSDLDKLSPAATTRRGFAARARDLGGNTMSIRWTQGEGRGTHQPGDTIVLDGCFWVARDEGNAAGQAAVE